MRLLVQRSLESSVKVDNKVVGHIKRGLVVLVGFTYNDDITNIKYLIDKLVNLRIFNDENGIMNKSILENNGNILSISQFTLYADTTKGRRPSYVNALNNIEAEKLYNIFNQELKKYVEVETGVFGADMLVNINNDGPVTIMLEKENDKK